MRNPLDWLGYQLLEPLRWVGLTDTSFGHWCLRRAGGYAYPGTELEKKCCHLGSWGLDGAPFSEWRREFKEISLDDHCKDCPALTSTERGQP